MPKKLSWRTRNKITIWLFNIPAYFFILAFSLIPVAYAFYMSLLTYDIIDPPIRFSGLENYVYMLTQSPTFWDSLLNTLYFSFACVGLVLITSLLLATLLNEQLRGTKAARALSLIPWAIPPIVCGIIWSWSFDGSYGVINHILSSLGIIDQYIPFLGSQVWAMPTVIVARTWREVPFATLLLLAGLKMIPRTLYEAAEVDGANTWQRFRKITLPLIRNPILLVLVFETMWSLRALDEIYAMTAGGPASATTVLGWLVYVTAFRFYNFGRGAAVAFILALITLAIALIYTKVLYRKIEF